MTTVHPPDRVQADTDGFLQQATQLEICTKQFCFFSQTTVLIQAYKHPANTLPMLIVHVHVDVKPEYVEAFKAATLENAQQSLREPGVARFDILQQADAPTKFILVEVYRRPDAPAAHKETVHYAKWRDTVAPMMAEPRTSVKFTNVFPDDTGF